MDAIIIQSHFREENIPVISVGYVFRNYFLVTLDLPEVHTEAVFQTIIWKNWKKRFIEKLDRMGYNNALFTYADTFGVYVAQKKEE